MTNALKMHHRPRNLLGTRYSRLARNTIDYWMLPEDPTLTRTRVLEALGAAEVEDDASLQLYVHVPFCAQRCTFCAFSGANSISFKMADRYSKLLAWQVRDMVRRTRARNMPLRSVHIGGGSPDILGIHIGRLLRTIRDLEGVHGETEISVEFTLSTAPREFIDLLVDFGVTKASFGIQTLDPRIRRTMRQPARLEHLGRVLNWIDGRIPVVNADLITCLPGQTLRQAERDLRSLMDHPGITAISSYLLTPGASPSMTAGLLSGKLPPQATPEEQALMRLNTYGTLLREGWIRRGTNTYVNPRQVQEDVIERTSGNECIGQSHYEAFLLGAGASAVSSVPGARLEQTSELGPWCETVERGEYPLNLKTCSVVPQRDTALWVFPLRYEGLPVERFDRMVKNGVISNGQFATFQSLLAEGLVIQTEDRYELSILGEVFMGQLVRDLKTTEGRTAVDHYIAEGYDLGRAISERKIKDTNIANNRQLSSIHLETEQ